MGYYQGVSRIDFRYLPQCRLCPRYLQASWSFQLPDVIPYSFHISQIDFLASFPPSCLPMCQLHASSYVARVSSSMFVPIMWPSYYLFLAVDFQSVWLSGHDISKCHSPDFHSDPIILRHSLSAVGDIYALQNLLFDSSSKSALQAFQGNIEGETPWPLNPKYQGIWLSRQSLRVNTHRTWSLSGCPADSSIVLQATYSCWDPQEPLFCFSRDKVSLTMWAHRILPF